MIISKDFNIMLRDALAIHYGLDKVYVSQREDFDTYYRIEIIINDHLEWMYRLNMIYLLALNISFEDLVESIIDEFEEAKRGKMRKESEMEDYKLRMVKEYKELKNKYDKLHAMLVKYDAGKLDFTPTCSIDLLRKQASVMGQYLYILETRAAIENVDLKVED